MNVISDLTIKIVGVLLAITLAALAWAVAHARPQHRAVAWWCTAVAAADVVHWALAAWVLAPARAALGTAPYAGASRVAFHIQQAAVVARPVGLAALAAVVLLSPPAARLAARAASGVYAASVAALALAYPALRGDALGRVYFGAELAALLAAGGALAAWWPRRAWPTLTEGTVLVVGVLQIGVVIAWRRSFAGFPAAALVMIVAFAALLFLHAGELLWDSRQPSSSR